MGDIFEKYIININILMPFGNRIGNSLGLIEDEDYIKLESGVLLAN